MGTKTYWATTAGKLAHPKLIALSYRLSGSIVDIIDDVDNRMDMVEEPTTMEEALADLRRWKDEAAWLEEYTRKDGNPNEPRPIALIIQERNEARTVWQAIGLATTAVPTMEMDSSDPIGMMHQVVDSCNRLRGYKAFYDHIQAHLDQDDIIRIQGSDYRPVVVCKICGRSADDIRAKYETNAN